MKNIAHIDQNLKDFITGKGGILTISDEYVIRG